MSGKQARAARRRFDPRQYQLVLIGALRWLSDPPGQCSGCEQMSAQPRSRFTGYDSGALRHAAPRPGERDCDHAERVYREQNHRQREGDFSEIGNSSVLCMSCALWLGGLLGDRDDDSGLTLMYLWQAVQAIRAGIPCWTAFLVLAEPGAENYWKEVCVSAREAEAPYDPAQVYRAVRRQVEGGVVEPDSPASFHVRPLSELME